MWKYIAATVVFLGLYALLAQKVQASTVVASDSFSDGYLQSHWVLATGAAATAQVVNDALTISITQPQQITQLYLDQTLPENYHIAYEMTPHSGSDKNIYTKYFDQQNWMQLHLSGDTYYFVAKVNDQVLLLDTGSYEWQNGTTKQVTIRNEAGYVAIHLDGQLLVSAGDLFAGLQGGYFSIVVGTGAVFPTSVSFDNLVITNLAEEELPDGVVLPVSSLKQHDPAWGTNEYDSAHQWSSQTSIADWGCALTSAVMLMRYHGLINMPNGEPLNPGTVNQWLKENHGYTGGLVSFASLTVLSKKIADVYGTPKLEYQKQAPLVTGIIEQIAQDRPIILELPGHFVVGNGYTTADLRIVDPAFEYSLLSQHGKQLLSYRTLTPSYTDLRMLEILLPAGSTGHLVDQNGNTVPGSTSFTTTITTPNGESNTVAVIEVPKLPAGEYHVLVSGDAHEVQLKSVTADGEQSVILGVVENGELLIVVDEGGGAAVAAAPPPPPPTPSPIPSPTANPTPTATPNPSLPPSPVSLLPSASPRDVIITTSVSPNIHTPITITQPTNVLPIGSATPASTQSVSPPTAPLVPTISASTASMPTALVPTKSTTTTPWCPTNTNQTTAQATTKSLPIIINLIPGWDSLSDMLSLLSTFATTVMAKN